MSRNLLKVYYKLNMRKMKFFILSVVATLSIACSTDDNNSKVEEVEKITVINIDKSMLMATEWFKGKSSYINEKFESVEAIKDIPCGTDNIVFSQNYYETINHSYINECLLFQAKFDYKTEGNQIFSMIEEYQLFYTVMTLNENRLVLLQKVDPTDKNTPAGAKYIKLEYFKYSKPNN